MSYGFNILFNADGDLARCSEQLGRVLGCTFIKSADGESVLYAAQCLGLELTVIADHGFVNDQGIPFEEYTFVISIQLIHSDVDDEISLLFHETAARFIFALTAVRMGWRSLLLADVQRILATYPK